MSNEINPPKIVHDPGLVKETRTWTVMDLGNDVIIRQEFVNLAVGTTVDLVEITGEEEATL